MSVRKSAKQVREEEALALQQVKKKKNQSKPDQDGGSRSLFENIENQKRKKDATLPEIKEYLSENAIGKQGSFYLNEPMMKLFRKKVVMEDTSIAEVVRQQLIENYFTEEELREVYNTMDV